MQALIRTIIDQVFRRICQSQQELHVHESLLLSIFKGKIRRSRFHQLHYKYVVYPHTKHLYIIKKVHTCWYVGGAIISFALLSQNWVPVPHCVRIHMIFCCSLCRIKQTDNDNFDLYSSNGATTTNYSSLEDAFNQEMPIFGFRFFALTAFLLCWNYSIFAM